MRAAAIGLGLLTMGLAAVGLAEGLPSGASPMAVVITPMDPSGEPQIVDLRIVGDEVPIPRNGSVLIFARADGWPAEDAMPIVQVSKTTGAETTTFGGVMLSLGDYYWSWTPTQPLEVGDYAISLAHRAFGSVTYAVHIVADAVLDPPAFTSEPLAVYATEFTEYATCQSWGGIALLPGPMIATRERGQAEVIANLSFSSDPTIVHQFLYRAIAPVDGESQLRASGLPVVGGPFTVQAEEYCFGIEAVDITTGTVHPYPDVELCAPHGALPDLSERDVAVTDETLSRYSCMVPPTGFEERWCEVNDQCITLWLMPELAASNNCQLYFDTCPDAEMPVPSAGTGGMTMDAGGGAGTGGSGRRDAGFAPWFGQGDAAAEDDAGAEDDKAAVSHGSGCAVARRTGAAAASPGACTALAALGLLIVRRRKRGQPARRAA